MSKSGKVVDLYDHDEVMRLYDEERSVYEQEGKAKKVVTDSLASVGSAEHKALYGAVQILGQDSSTIYDILCAQHPEIKALPVEDVRGAIGELLGELAYQQPPLNAETVGVVASLLTIPSLKERFVTAVEEATLRAMIARPDKTETELLFVTRHLAALEQTCASVMTDELRSVFKEVRTYYERVCNGGYVLPNIVPELQPGRAFPDIYQRINIDAIERKKRMLVADEMGSGKSASAILAKERVSPGMPALVLVPSNVEETWLGYLSSKRDTNTKGYFKVGSEPRVLVVKSGEDVARLETETFDYVVCSHERLARDAYAGLPNIDFGMVIIDEVHKLKNVSGGKQSEHAQTIVEKLTERDGHLALLSGTPIPNKVRDIAVLLKMLHPEQFKNVSPAALTKRIVTGDTLELRALLVPFMQRKKLKDHIELPPVTETTVSVQLTEAEERLYEYLLEEDEMMAREKIRVLRQAVMNPAMLDFAPGKEFAKKTALYERLNTALQTKDSVVVFTNDFTDGILRGEHSVVDASLLPNDVEIGIVDGDTGKRSRGGMESERTIIQNKLKDKSKKRVIFVSGKTADVGIDYSAAEHVIFYNEGWTVPEKQQQLARVARPGLTVPLTVETLIAEGTIEHGMHLYAEAKHRIVEKLLNGVAISELEQKLVENDPGDEQDGGVDPKFAQFYLSQMQQLVRLFGNARELGTERFAQWLQKYGEAYANSYELSGRRNYHANVARMNGSVLTNIIEESGQRFEDVSVVDVGSGPEMLRRYAPERLQKAIMSVDANATHFKNAQGKTAVANFSELSTKIPEGSVDYVNCSLALNYTQYLPSKEKLDRIDTLCEINKILKVGGKAVVTLPYMFTFPDQAALEEVLFECGFSIVSEYTGDAQSGNMCRAQVLTLEKLQHVPKEEARVNIMELDRSVRDGLKMKANNSKLIKQRSIVSGFTLGGTEYVVEHNAEDMIAKEEEEAALADIRALKALHGGSIAKIKDETLVREGFSRVRGKHGLLLFKKLKSGGVVAGDNVR